MKTLIDDLKLHQIGEWKFLYELGGGKASATLLYANRKKEKSVVKMLFAPRNEMEIENMRNEVSALKQLNSLPRCYTPKLLMNFTKVEQYPIFYYMMEYVSGVELKKLFEKDKLPWNWEKATEIICRISFALSQGSPHFVHRDLHPGNILILDKVEFDRYSQRYEEPGVRILDYGCSKDVFKGFLGDWYEDKFRHPGAISTWSPEFINAPDLVDSSHDSWALGVLFYRLILNEYPVYAESFGALLEGYKNLKTAYGKIDSLSIPGALKILIKGTLDEDPKVRILPNEIFYCCSDLLNTDLLDCDDSFIDKYFKFRCAISKCARCGTYIGRNHSRCAGCGAVCDEENLVPVLKRRT